MVKVFDPEEEMCITNFFFFSHYKYVINKQYNL